MSTDYLVEARQFNAWQQPVEDKDLTTSPSVSKGVRYIIAGTGGAWSGGTINDIAQYNGATWDFATPEEGWIIWVKDENKYYKFDGSNWVAYKTAVIGLTLDGGGQAIEIGNKGYIRIPYACTITKWTLLADQSGSIKIDIWKDSYANYPPTDADTITAANEPELSSAIKAEDATLSGWTTSITAGDVLGFYVDSASIVKRVVLQLEVTKT